MPDPTDLPTPEQVAAYLTATGWEQTVLSDGDVWIFDHPDHSPRISVVVCSYDVDHARGTLERIARCEGRPTPAEQVRRDMVTLAAFGDVAKAVRDE